MIDLRSDTVTRPSDAMRLAMSRAEVGDDVYGDDPSVNLLEQEAAELTGKEAALFLPTGTQANLVALLTHCQRGEEYIVGQKAHNYLFEAGGAAVLGSIQPQPIDAAADGTLPLDVVASVIKPDDVHFARTKLLCIENTHNGKVLPLDYLQQAWVFTREKGLALHVDGARIMNATVALNVPLSTLTQYCDTLTIAFPKDWARRLVRFCAAALNTSSKHVAGVKWSVVGCVRPVFWPRRHAMRCSTTLNVCEKTTITRSGWRMNSVPLGSKFWHQEHKLTCCSSKSLRMKPLN